MSGLAQVPRQISKAAVLHANNVVQLFIKQRMVLQPDLTPALAHLYPATALFVENSLNEALMPTTKNKPTVQQPALPATDMVPVGAADEQLIKSEQDSRVMLQPPSEHFQNAAKILKHDILRGAGGTFSYTALSTAKVLRPAQKLQSALDDLTTGSNKVPILLEVCPKIKGVKTDHYKK